MQKPSAVLPTEIHLARPFWGWWVQKLNTLVCKPWDNSSAWTAHYFKWMPTQMAERWFSRNYLELPGEQRFQLRLFSEDFCSLRLTTVQHKLILFIRPSPFFHPSNLICLVIQTQSDVRNVWPVCDSDAGRPGKHSGTENCSEETAKREWEFDYLGSSQCIAHWTNGFCIFICFLLHLQQLCSLYEGLQCLFGPTVHQIFIT